MLPEILDRHAGTLNRPLSGDVGEHAGEVAQHADLDGLGLKWCVCHQ